MTTGAIGATPKTEPSILLQGIGTGKKFKNLMFGLHALEEPMEDCSLLRGTAKIEGIQFSSSGATLESFRFTDTAGNQWSIPTNIGNLSNGAKRDANNFVRVGHSYFMVFQVCGSGGYPSLIEIYDAEALKPL